MTRSQSTSAGFTLVEMMVAMVVLSIGMLGVANLFVITLQSNKSSTSRLHAINYVGDLADRIRANRTAGVAYAGVGADNGCAGQAIGAVACTPVQLAANDLFLWRQQIARTWTGGSAAGTVVFVAGAAGAPSTYTITVTWREQGNPQDLSSALVLQI